MIKHGRESLVKISSGRFVSKEPLHGRTVAQKREWLARQKRAADAIQKLADIGNDAYGVPRIKSLDEKNFYVLEERVAGVPLTPLLFRTLDDAAREKVIDSLAQFYADMHSIDMIPNPVEYKMEYSLNDTFLVDFVATNMAEHFPLSEVKFVEKTYKYLMKESYETRLVQTHGDLVEDNVLYDYKKRKINVIDFTEVGSVFLHYDLLDSYLCSLDIMDAVRTRYLKYRNLCDLPRDFTDDARWNRISGWHHAANIMDTMDELVSDFSYQNKSERNSTMNCVKIQIEKLHQLER